MTISYKWLSEYLPIELEPTKLSRILTSVGLEVESLTYYEEIKGGLQGLIVGEVLETSKHPNADKLTLTKVSIGNGKPLQIVCGAPNVAPGQKVIVAPVGTTIFPIKGEPLTMRLAKIRGEESYGMICAEDEVGLGESHEGILVLSANAEVGKPASEYFPAYDDWIYEIGLTPNRMDAMSHWGVARDVCAWLNLHHKKGTRAKLPLINGFKADDRSLSIEVSIENEDACRRYAGVSISGLKVGESPLWLQHRLKSIGLRPINNIVDITNYIQHETGQPLHAFDADKIKGKKIIVKNLAEGTKFTSLDEKVRTLSKEDLMICDTEGGLCIAGVFGGLNSGVTENTTNIFLESAWFNPVTTRRTSFRHGLRTDAATRFEKGVDISNTANVLKRAAQMIKEIAGGIISSDLVDVYPDPEQKKEVVLKNHYLKKLSGKNYHPDTTKEILQSLGFEIKKEGIDELWVTVPYHKPDVSHPADVVEEIVRIDGLDNIEIPERILISPAIDENIAREASREKISNWMAGLGFNEIMTNPITNSAYFSESELKRSVKMLNSLSAELDIMRTSMLETGLESVAHNLNRKNNDLKFFEFGKTYHTSGVGNYEEREHLSIFITGSANESSWKSKSQKTDLYYIKGVIQKMITALGLPAPEFQSLIDEKLSQSLSVHVKGKNVGKFGETGKKSLQHFDIKQPVYFADLQWQTLVDLSITKNISYSEIPKFPSVNRDIALIVDRKVQYMEVDKAITALKIVALKEISLFDIFESEKVGAGKKSMAISLTFLDVEKTLTDKEIDSWMTSIMDTLQKKLGAEIRSK